MRLKKLKLRKVKKMSKWSLKSVLSDLLNSKDLSPDERADLRRAIEKLKDMEINILVTGATGCGKSSTINALFNVNAAQVGQGVDPETMDIVKYESDGLVIWDSPGLGDGKEADERHSCNIIGKLLEKDKNGDALIDVVLVILDGSSRDLRTSYELINEIIIKTLQKSGENSTDRLLVAINQCDMAMKGRNWNEETNRSEAALVNFLEEKVASTRRRIQEATGVTVNPIYYSAGYKDGDNDQNPYNISRLLRYIIENIPEGKRPLVADNIKVKTLRDDTHQDKLKEQEKIENDIATALSKLVGSAAEKVISTVSNVAGVIGSAVISAGRAILGWLGF